MKRDICLFLLVGSLVRHAGEGRNVQQHVQQEREESRERERVRESERVRERECRLQTLIFFESGFGLRNFLKKIFVFRFLFFL